MSTQTLARVTSSYQTPQAVATESAVASILVVDRHPESISRELHFEFAPQGYRIETATSAFDALDRVRSAPPAVVLLDAHLSDQCGLELHRKIRRIDANIPVIFIGANRSADVTITAMKQGAYDFLFKPIDERQLHRAVAHALEFSPQKRTATAGLVEPLPVELDGELCGTSAKMRDVYKSIGLVAAQDVNVLITGESGTGKELIARAIVRHSSRSDKPFLALNCAAIPENLLESELFGHEKGAFSGADRRRIGKFEQCDGGTILLDEIGDMPLSLQAKILRLIQEQSFERVGGNETIRTNVRVIASTHRDLMTRSAEEKFRADLYYRLSVFTIELPPLRERDEDLPALAHHFLRKYSHDMGRDTHEISPEAMDLLQQYSWPGNVRELQSIIRQALLRSNGHVLLPTSLPPLRNGPSEPPVKQLPAPAPAPKSNVDFDMDQFLKHHLGPNANDLYADLHRELDRYALAKVLTYTRGNQHTASKVLGIARQTLRTKLRESGLHVRQSVETDGQNLRIA